MKNVAREKAKKEEAGEVMCQSIDPSSIGATGVLGSGWICGPYGVKLGEYAEGRDP